MEYLYEFIYKALYNFYIPVMVIWIFICIVRMTKSNALGFAGAGVAIFAFVSMITTTSYKAVFDVAVFGLVPVFILLIISGWYHEQYKRKVAETDPVYEKVKERIAKQMEADKIKALEKRENK